MIIVMKSTKEIKMKDNREGIFFGMYFQIWETTAIL